MYLLTVVTDATKSSTGQSIELEAEQVVRVPEQHRVAAKPERVQPVAERFAEPGGVPLLAEDGDGSTGSGGRLDDDVDELVGEGLGEVANLCELALVYPVAVAIADLLAPADELHALIRLDPRLVGIADEDERGAESQRREGATELARANPEAAGLAVLVRSLERDHDDFERVRREHSRTVCETGGERCRSRHPHPPVPSSERRQPRTGAEAPGPGREKRRRTGWRAPVTPPVAQCPKGAEHRLRWWDTGP